MTQDTQITQFNFNDNEVRCQIINNEPWFVAKDICDILDLKDVNRTLSKLDDNERGTQSFSTLGGMQKMSIVNESGLYNLIFRSNKIEAKVFKIWVTSEVLPSIRKHGSYSTTEQAAIPQPQQNNALSDALRALKLTSIDNSLKSTAQVLSMYKFIKFNTPAKMDTDLCSMFDTLIAEMIATRLLVQDLIPSIKLPDNTNKKYSPKPVIKRNQANEEGK
ncbi:MAG: Bro-N domain-containing protein [Sulfurimonas sp.]|jgi:prophage antirepressor-like protein